jgi:hypothetical protein
MELDYDERTAFGLHPPENKITALIGGFARPPTGNSIRGVSPMRVRNYGLSLACLLAVVALALSVVGCNNTLNPLCASARPAPLIAALAPSNLTFSEVQNGTTLTVTGSNFVSSTEVLVGSTPLAANVLSPKKLTVKLTTGVISKPGTVRIAVETPAGNTSDLGCTSGGKSSALMLTVN